MSQEKMHLDFWLGVDVSKDSFDAALALEDATPSQWAKLPVQHFEMSPAGLKEFAQWIKPHCEKGDCLGVCIESTGIYSHQFVDLISTLALPDTSMVNPALPHAFRKSFGLRDKCDRVDAAVLALYGVVHRPAPNCQRSPEYARLRTLWRLRQDYMEDLTRWKNRLEQALDAGQIKHIKKTIRHLEGETDRVWKEIEEWVQSHGELCRDIELMCTIPGVKEKTAIMVLAEVGDLRGWKRNQLTSYAGLYPKVYSSGTSVAKKPCLAGGGGKEIRKGLFLPACCTARCNPTLKQWRQQLLDNGKAKMSTIGARMRKLLLLMRSVVVHQRPYDPNFEELKA